MPGRKPKDKNRVDVDYILSWALYHSKVPVKEIAKERDLTDKAIYYQIKQVDNALDQKLDKDKLIKLVWLCYPAALDSLIYNLRVKKDASVTNNFVNKTFFADVKENESNSTTNIFNLGSGLDRGLRQADTELIQAIAERLRNGDREKGTPPVVSRIEGSSEH